jgi:sarcosine oxidase subunit gamma
VADFAFTPRSPFAGILRGYGTTPAGITVTDRDGTGMASVLAVADTAHGLAERLQAEYGFALPQGPRRAATGAVACIGVGRGRWLATRDAGGNGFADDLATQLTGLAAVADQSDGYALLRLGGPALRRVFAKGIGIDLHPAAFAVDDAATTAIGHIGVMLWRLQDGADGSPVFEVALFRSMAQSFWHWLASSAGEFGLAVVAPGRG